MKILRSVNDVTEFITVQRGRNASIGFVPTMGALHEGHLSLVKKSVEGNDVTIVSVFVNPTQFNNPDDLKSYPRKEEDDFKLLAAEKVDAVFAPSVNEIYPDGCGDDEKNSVKLGRVAEVMEGKHRPGHFQGVVQIVSKLFSIINPTRAYFGEKDFQQIAVIKEMVRSQGLNVEIIPCPIKRANDGLALSSRNELLTEKQRKIAPEIHQTLKYSVEYSRNHSVKATHDMVVEHLDAIPEMKVEYFEIVDGRTLEPVDEWEESPWIVGCITVYCGEVRLIDNIVYCSPNS